MEEKKEDIIKENANEKKKSSKKKIIIPLVSIAIVAIIAGIVVVKMNINSEDIDSGTIAEEEKESQTNESNAEEIEDDDILDETIDFEENEILEDYIGENSEAVFIEENDIVSIEDRNLVGNMEYNYDKYHYGETALAWTVGIGQTGEKDEKKTAGFTMSGGSITSDNGGIFYVSNTNAYIVLKDVEIIPATNNDFFLKCTSNNNTVNEEETWGIAGDNGATCNLTAISQEMEGNVLWDSISQLYFYMTEGSTLTGAIIDEESSVVETKRNVKMGCCNLYISQDSTWIVTGDSTLSTLSSEGKIVDENGKQVTIVGTNGTTYVSGDSQYTITVDRYVDTVDLNGAMSI